ncbi:MBL fold metallo-hydrolase [Lottiidibacillus patelloidae]|uniref:MBL fold metallo-hydrolase n=1 Tax=Lottiidibacillus patelloidae TaxID=2670334 RepID=A0A263BWG4_9BACI|nr:MBL fold metallo-hydrolase [Lottiidibacillus patelloidae]OZM58083.1 MBL fold metallo-hydrolase [Lottiidibacillus patelloidae]
MVKAISFKSKHFTLEEICHGVYAAIAKDAGRAASNAGFIDLGEQTMVFDTFNTQQAAEDLKNVAEKITKQPVSWVINSHHHGDHVRGNQVFSKSNILSSVITRQQILENQALKIQKQQNDLEGLHQYINSLKTKLDKQADKNIENQLNFLKEIAISLPSLKLTPPNYTFKQEFTFCGSKRTAKLKTFGSAHSACDAILYLPEDEVIFMSDLLFVNTHPVIFPESNPDQWMTILEEIEKLVFQFAVPGHGPIGTKTDLLNVKEYLEELYEVVSDSGNVEEFQMPDKYKSWSSPSLYQQNIKNVKAIKENHNKG